MTRSTRRRTRGAFALATLSVVALVAAGCSSSDSGDNGGSGGDQTTGAAGSLDCGQFSSYGDLKGKSVTIYAGIVAPEDQPYIDSFKPFEDCTGVKVNYTADKNFEQQVLVQAQAGNAPDLAIVPQPGLLKQLVATGKAVAAPQAVSDNVDKWFGADWKKYGTVDGKFYAAPSGASVKSLVWYSPKVFAEKGWKVPTTLDELKSLSDTIAATGDKPWCAGISSGEATGWPITDWVEDFVLRLDGPEAYDDWVDGKLKFTDPKIVDAFNAVGDYLKNPNYVNAGFGGVNTIATTTFQDAGLGVDPTTGPTCYLHRMASFYAANFPEGTDISENGDVFAFYLPGKTADEKPVLGAGEFVLAFSDRPEVQALQQYWSSDFWANEKAKMSSKETNGGWITANKGLDAANLVNPIDKLSVQILQDPKSVFRFDGSDQMPAAVGSGSFWKQATAWITGQSTEDTVTKIQAAWPNS